MCLVTFDIIYFSEKELARAIAAVGGSQENILVGILKV